MVSAVNNMALLAAERYTASGVVFDGTNDWLTRGADWTGVADGKVGLVSFWIKFTGGDGVLQVFYNDQALSEIQKTTGNKILLDFYTAAVGQVFRYQTSTSVTVASGWVHVLASWDAAATTFQMYLNDASDSSAVTPITDVTIDYSRTDHTIGRRNATATAYLVGNLADFYFNQAAYMDISVTANRRKFISSTLKPVFLGATGQLPTGTAPILFLSGPVANFATNKGSGGGMTTNGTLTNDPASPSY